ncbi:MAG: hypothetical protein MZV65_13165 [Chromatiales bacterium]|nr:hypothetical protein [Chromatiales bacterium]
MLADFDPAGIEPRLAQGARRSRRASKAWTPRAAIPGCRARRTISCSMHRPACRAASCPALVQRTQTILVPVLPSATDMRATARFVHELLLVAKDARQETRIASVANRVPVNNPLENAAELAGYESVSTRLYRPLERFLARLQNPVHRPPCRTLPPTRSPTSRASSIFELEGALGGRDRLAWQPLLDWLDSPRSLPRSA